MTNAPSRTNGFLFSDLRDYTRFVESQGDAAAAALLEDYRALVRLAVGEFGGAEIKTEGDSFYVVFPSASSAVQCGLSIVQAASKHTAAGGTPIKVGIGVHAGETVETAEGYVGSAVNVAARVCSQARAGELLVTDTVRALTRTFLAVRFEDRKSVRLKGIAEQVVVYRVEPLGAGETLATDTHRRSGILGGLARSKRMVPIAIVVAGVILGGAAGAALLSGGRPGATPLAATPSNPAPSSAGPTPRPIATAAAFPDADEGDLISQLPLGIRDACVRTVEPVDRVGTVASVECVLDLAAEAETVWYDQFATLQQLSSAVFSLIEKEKLPPADCAAGALRGRGNWSVGSTHSGRLLCYQNAGKTWFVWTYDAERILARAVRGGEAPEDWLEMHDWWAQTRLFLQ